MIGKKHAYLPGSFFMKKQIRSSLFILAALSLGILTGMAKTPLFTTTASFVSDLFLGALQLISIPIVFLSVIATITGFESYKEMKFLGKKVLKYTLITTLMAATIALFFYIAIHPPAVETTVPLPPKDIGHMSFLKALSQMFPTNFVAVFLQNNVFGAALLSVALGFSILTLPEKHRSHMHIFFSGLFQALLKITQVIIRFIPVGIWAFTTLFLEQVIRDYKALLPLSFYFACVIASNLFQGFFVLPFLLKIKGISPLKVFKNASPALLTAFFSKSSSAALPLSIECATSKGGISKKVANFSLPLCSVINMNGCAAFILITVIFVSTSSGVVFTLPMMLLWILLSTMAAIGNASVPMGCYFLSSAFLVGMGIPIHLMGLILPFYALIDMVETCLNVWSDVSITNIIHKEVTVYEEAQKELAEISK